MSVFKDLVRNEIKAKLAGSPEELQMDMIKVAILHAIQSGHVNVEVDFDSPLNSDSLSKLRALCYLELGFDVPDMTSFSIFIDFRHFL